MGNNLATVDKLIDSINVMIKSLPTSWSSISDNDFSKLLKDNYFTEIKLPLSSQIRYDIDQSRKIIVKLQKLRKSYAEIENSQIMSNSDMDHEIITSWKLYVGDHEFLYGSLSDKQIQNQRDTITRILIKRKESNC